ncbi:MAG: CorA family divalent cation transporter [Actinomycetes bacterium]
MDVRFLTSTGVETCSVEALRSLLDRDDGFVWVDVPTFDEEADRVLSTAFGFHEMALRLCHERNHLPATHAYPDAIFSILHAPEPGTPGHVHLLELDQFVGRRFLVTVHGPLNPVVPLERALEEPGSALASRARSAAAPVAGRAVLCHRLRARALSACRHHVRRGAGRCPGAACDG